MIYLQNSRKPSQAARTIEAVERDSEAELERLKAEVRASKALIREEDRIAEVERASTKHYREVMKSAERRTEQYLLDREQLAEAEATLSRKYTAAAIASREHRAELNVTNDRIAAAELTAYEKVEDVAAAHSLELDRARAAKSETRQQEIMFVKLQVRME